MIAYMFLRLANHLHTNKDCIECDLMLDVCRILSKPEKCETAYYFSVLFVVVFEENRVHINAIKITLKVLALLILQVSINL